VIEYYTKYSNGLMEFSHYASQTECMRSILIRRLLRSLGRRFKHMRSLRFGLHEAGGRGRRDGRGRHSFV